MKKKISIIFAILIIVAIAGTIIYVKSKEEKPEEVVNQYISLKYYTENNINYH